MTEVWFQIKCETYENNGYENVITNNWIVFDVVIVLDRSVSEVFLSSLHFLFLDTKGSQVKALITSSHFKYFYQKLDKIWVYAIHKSGFPRISIIELSILKLLSAYL
jgi:hypothetical protein